MFALRFSSIQSIQHLNTRCYASNTTTTIGFIGLGNMGAHMARNLVKKGHSLVVFDINEAAVKSLESLGASSASSVSDVAAQADCIVTMLPSNPHVLDVYLGKEGILASAKPNTLMIDASTIDPSVSLKVFEAASEGKHAFVDAPVSGGVGGAEGGTLTFMVGGTEVSFERSKEVLYDMGKNIVHCGKNGTGQVAKICNNMLLAISMAGVAEAMNLGTRLGIEPKMLANIINTSSGRCWSSDTYNPCPGVIDGVPASKGYEGGFGSALMLKDLGLASAAATDSKSPIPMGETVHQMYQLMCHKGYSTKDFGSIYQFLQNEKISN